MFEIIKSDIKNNHRAGLLAVLLLVNYRFGRCLMLKKKTLRFYWIPYIWCLLLSRGLSLVFGCSVPFSAQIGKSVVFKHGFFGVFISGLAVVGDGCVIFHHVTIGSNFGSRKNLGAPTIGDNVLIGAGAKVIGPLRVDDEMVVPAGSVVFSDVQKRHR
ncbi:LbetaH domain-containing protein [Alcanivorax sediminis]|uniref:Serine acetyltransferase n=1 Tax=Alcanivorax sediminis TaxID=2663008 RepID=A0A6N7LVU1_9GAMM|nr:serine acetyltransferase [Alcanivorax sediminis]MQX54383.1 serine acetyltransferase [Alcanivorax sediminis]